jgi:rhamnose transport system ATP-binding protein
LLLEAREIDKSYGGVHALRSVSFNLRAGEVHAIVGENGAGKSTLIKVLTGAVEPDAGSLWLDEQRVENNNPHHARGLGIAAIYQQPAIFPTLTVAENIALANEHGGLARRVDWAQRIRTARELMQSVGAEIAPERECARADSG